MYCVHLVVMSKKKIDYPEVSPASVLSIDKTLAEFTGERKGWVADIPTDDWHLNSV